jgi:hypothetical protein
VRRQILKKKKPPHPQTGANAWQPDPCQRVASSRVDPAEEGGSPFAVDVWKGHRVAPSHSTTDGHPVVHRALQLSGSGVLPVLVKGPGGIVIKSPSGARAGI